MARAYEIPGRVAIAELDLEPLLARVELHQAVSPSVFPPVDFDLSFLVDAGSPIAGPGVSHLGCREWAGGIGSGVRRLYRLRNLGGGASGGNPLPAAGTRPDPHQRGGGPGSPGHDRCGVGPGGEATRGLTSRWISIGSSPSHPTWRRPASWVRSWCPTSTNSKCGCGSPKSRPIAVRTIPPHMPSRAAPLATARCSSGRARSTCTGHTGSTGAPMSRQGPRAPDGESCSEAAR